MSESIGAALRAGREQRRLTLAQVSEATRLRIHYILALENDDLSAMPSAAQGRGFMRIYAQFLGLDLDALIPLPVPAPAAAAEAPTTPAKVESPGPSAPAAEAVAGAAVPAILSGLRDRLAQRLRRRTAEAQRKETTDSAPSADPDSKKKVAG
jgi:transcriptional regulator with XRE-family HTH domain